MKSSASLQQSATRPSSQVRTYLAGLPAATRKHVEELREVIRRAAPGAGESFGYGMPSFSLHGKPFVWYAAWKRHTSFYPLSQATARSLAAELEGYEISGKGTIRFRLDKPLPKTLVRRLVKARIAEYERSSPRRRV